MHRLTSWWHALQETLWFNPAVMTLLAVALALSAVQLDKQVLPAHRFHAWWLFEGGAEGARGVLTAIAGTMMTVATTAFSITIVALQLGSSQFSPRVLRGFTGDRGNQIVLGAFIATFVYSLVVLRSVRSATADATVFVPSLAVTIAIVLALLSIASLIYFFHHATRTIQASVIIDRIAADTFRLIEQELDTAAEYQSAFMPPSNRGTAVDLRSETTGYVIGLNEHALCRLAEQHGGILVLHISIGDYLLTGTTIASLLVDGSGDAPRHDRGDDHGGLLQATQRALTMATERTLEWDVRFGFRQLADIAIKALSPGINDPTTATMCIDRLGEALLRARGLPDGVRTCVDHTGRPRLVQQRAGFASLLRIAVEQIRHYGASDATVITHLLRMLSALADGAPGEIRPIVTAEARDVMDEALRKTDLPADRARLHAAAAWAL